MNRHRHPRWVGKQIQRDDLWQQPALQQVQVAQRLRCTGDTVRASHVDETAMTAFMRSHSRSTACSAIRSTYGNAENDDALVRLSMEPGQDGPQILYLLRPGD